MNVPKQKINTKFIEEHLWWLMSCEHKTQSELRDNCETFHLRVFFLINLIYTTYSTDYPELKFINM